MAYWWEVRKNWRSPVRGPLVGKQYIRRQVEEARRQLFERAKSSFPEVCSATLFIIQIFQLANYMWWWWWLGNTRGNRITPAVLIFLHSRLKDVKCDPLYRAYPHCIFRHEIKKPLYRVLTKLVLKGEHFWHSEDRVSWYILTIKANEMHYFSN
jgi:hypothetical protein